MTTYKIVRTFRDSERRPQTIKRGLSLAEAQRHCRDPQTSSRTATTEEALTRTRLCGPWFDGYDEEKE